MVPRSTGTRLAYPFTAVVDTLKLALPLRSRGTVMEVEPALSLADMDGELVPPCILFNLEFAEPCAAGRFCTPDTGSTVYVSPALVDRKSTRLNSSHVSES